MGTGLIFAAVIAVWVAYGVPLALRRHEEATRDGSITTFSNALRVLTHRRGEESDDGEDAPASASRSLATDRTAAMRSSAAQGAAEPVATVEGAAETEVADPKATDVDTADRADADSADTDTQDVRAGAPSDAEMRDDRPAAATATSYPRPRNRAAARRAARRRRRVLGVLLLATLVVGVLAGTQVLLPWSVAIPAGLVVAWLVLCRVMVRGETRQRVAARPRTDRPAVTPKPKPKAKPKARRRPAPSAKAADPDAEATVVISGQIGDVEPSRKNVMEKQPLRQGDLDQQIVDAVAVTTTTGTTLWDPVPVTLPTYVTKPAARTVRTVEFASSDDVAGDVDTGRGARRAVGD